MGAYVRGEVQQQVRHRVVGCRHRQRGCLRWPVAREREDHAWGTDLIAGALARDGGKRRLHLGALGARKQPHAARRKPGEQARRVERGEGLAALRDEQNCRVLNLGGRDAVVPGEVRAARREPRDTQQLVGADDLDGERREGGADVCGDLLRQPEGDFDSANQKVNCVEPRSSPRLHPTQQVVCKLAGGCAVGRVRVGPILIDRVQHRRRLQQVDCHEVGERVKERRAISDRHAARLELQTGRLERTGERVGAQLKLAAAQEEGRGRCGRGGRSPRCQACARAERRVAALDERRGGPNADRLAHLVHVQPGGQRPPVRGDSYLECTRLGPEEHERHTHGEGDAHRLTLAAEYHRAGLDRAVRLQPKATVGAGECLGERGVKIGNQPATHGVVHKRSHCRRRPQFRARLQRGSRCGIGKLLDDIRAERAHARRGDAILPAVGADRDGDGRRVPFPGSLE
mmetsp:Transcript_16174/g.38379  ORF Transcript_16174/g.38379 Transcript_16174/m.38379 type:complete len:458 (+) Transcript_16174:2115-3488(+)